jgi:antitoxin (DNA-binding transcriptional repressor) of toxin-antitoxin stability system
MPRTSPRFAFPLLFIAAVAFAADDPGEALREAARAGDAARIEALLAAGAPVDAPARYGQTPLYFAAEKGHLAVVRLLLDRGANVNAGDRFFGASVLDMALAGRHREVALLLLERGADDAAGALEAGVQLQDVELAKAALATGKIEPLDLAAARRTAGPGTTPLHQLLAAATAKPRVRPPYQPPAERLAASAGRYRTGNGEEVTVTVRGTSLALTVPGQPEMVLHPVEADRFDSEDGNLSLAFAGRAGLIEWGLINRGGEVIQLGAVAATDPAATSQGVPRGRAALAPMAAGRKARAESRARPRCAASRMTEGTRNLDHSGVTEWSNA